MINKSAIRYFLALGLVVPAGVALAQSAGGGVSGPRPSLSATGLAVPRVGTPGSNVLFGGAAGSPRPVEQTSGFGNSAASVYSTGRPLFSGATARAQSGGLAGSSGTTTTGGLFQFTTRVPTGGTAGLPGTATAGGIGDIGTAAGTGGLAPQYARGLIANGATGGLGDSAGTSLTGGR